MTAAPGDRLRVAVLISGSGSNLQAIADAVAADRIPVDLAAVVSDRADAYGLERATAAGIPAVCLPGRDFSTRADYDAALGERLASLGPDLVVLAGFMRILTENLVAAWHGRMLNIHPSLLPKYKGLNTHARALEAGDAEAGCSVHEVTAELDGGRVLGQARVPVLPGDTADHLAARVLVREHELYPAVLRRVASGDRTRLDLL